jgi:hypothetical protein
MPRAHFHSGACGSARAKLGRDANSGTAPVWRTLDVRLRSEAISPSTNSTDFIDDPDFSFRGLHGVVANALPGA